MDKKVEEAIELLKDIQKDLELQLDWYHQHYSGKHLWSVEHRIEALKFILSELKRLSESKIGVCPHCKKELWLSPTHKGEVDE